MRQKRKFLQAQPEHSSKVMTLLVAFLFCLYAFSTFYPLFERIVAENLYFEGIAWNGSFQMLNPLKRMDVGQTPGKDFYFFHGIGTLLLHRPFYLLLGQNLWASNTAIYIVSFLCFTTSLYFFIKGVGLGKNYAFLLLPVFTSFFYEITPQLIYFKLNTPGVRSFCPILTTGVLLLFGNLLILKNKTRYNLLFSGLAGFLSSISFFISIEHGLAFSLATLITLLLCSPFLCSSLQKILSLIIFVTVLAITTILLFVMVCGVSWYKTLVMAFSIIPKEQFWYYGAPPNTVITNIWTFFLTPPTVYVYFIYIGLFLLLIWGVLFLCQRQTATDRLFCSLMFLFIVYGLLTTTSLFGYFSKEYFLPLVRVLVLSFFALLFWVGQKKEIVKQLLQSTNHRFYRMSIVGSIILVFFAFYMSSILVNLLLNKKNPHQMFIVLSWFSCWQVFAMSSIPFIGQYVKQFCAINSSFSIRKYQMHISSLVVLAALIVIGDSVSLPLEVKLIEKQRVISFPPDKLMLGTKWQQNISAVECLIGPFQDLQYRADPEEWHCFISDNAAKAYIPAKLKRPFTISGPSAKHQLSQSVHFLIANDKLPENLRMFGFVGINEKFFGLVKNIKEIGKHTIIELDYLRPNLPQSVSYATITYPYAPVKQGDLWFTYANIIQNGYKLINPATDYILHLLGQELRSNYRNNFIKTKPKFVGTMRGFFWTPRLQYAHFDFYELLYRYYTPMLLTPDYVIWEKQSDNWQVPVDQEWRPITIEDPLNIGLPSGKSAKNRLILVRFYYQTINKFDKLPIIGKTPRYWLNIKRNNQLYSMVHYKNKLRKEEFCYAPISLPPMPSAGQVEVPFLLPNDSSITIIPEIISPFGFSVKFDINAVQYREIEISQEAMYVLEEFSFHNKPLFDQRKSHAN